MNEITVKEEKKMTTAELAELFGVDVKTIQRAAMSLDSTVERVGSSHAMVFTEEQATLIKKEIASHHNLETRQIDSVTTELEENEVIKNALSILNHRAEVLQEALKQKEAVIEQLKPAANFAHQICDASNAIDIGECAKALNRGIGRNSLFEFLRNKGILNSSNIPYQKYIDAGYFRVIESKYTVPNGETRISLKTVVFQKGVAYINKLISKEVA